MRNRPSFKLIIVMILCLGSVVTLSGCSEQYKIERMVWQANKAAEPIFLNEGSVSSYEFKTVIALYEKIIARAPESNHALDSQFKIAQLYALEKEFDKSRAIYDIIIESHQGRQEINALALFEKGQTYEKEGNWPWALKLFKEISAKYEKTQLSFSVPLYIAHYYLENEKVSEAAQAYQAAIDQYQAIADKYPNTKGALMAENLIVRTYVEQEAWDNAVAYILGLDSKYALSSDTLLVLANIYENKLSDKQKALSIYKRILEEYPDYKAGEMLKKKVVELGN
ncbi:MAG: tetratricopeptide repeat protein [PVC group bacterium]|nr:tetratricopeptide repeat protein [PVC group bacterium]